MTNANRESRDARIARLKASRANPDPNADYSWEDDLPLAPKIPTEPGQTVAFMIPQGIGQPSEEEAKQEI